jgi:hypothetical protein
MNAAEKATQRVIENTLGSHGTYRKVDARLYVIKQGSTYVMINIVGFGGDRALCRVAAQLVKGVRMEGKLATQLLHLNTQLRFGAFGYDPADRIVMFSHSILGGETLSPEELVATLTDVALVADEYDDKIISKYGGQTMRELLEEAALERLLDANPEGFHFGGAEA